MSSPEPAWQEGAGSLLFLAAPQETGLIETMEAALPLTSVTCPAHLAHSLCASRERLLLTLLFLNAVGLRRTSDLRDYNGDPLALITVHRHAYGYRHTERFLAEVARGGADEALTQVVAKWTASLWAPPAHVADAPLPVFYIDGHRKPVYADALIPRSVIGRTGKVLGCRALFLLHDQEGHPLLVTTQRGDQHLTSELPAILMVYEQAADLARCKRIVVEREGVAVEFLAALALEG